MTDDEIFAELRTIIAELFEIVPSEITRQATVFQDLDLDSIDAMDFMETLEEKGCERDEEEELNGLRYFRDLVELVAGKLGAK